MKKKQTHRHTYSDIVVRWSFLMLPLPGSQNLCEVLRYSTGEGLAGLVGVQSQAVNMWEEDATVFSLYNQGKFLLIFLSCVNEATE